MNESANDVAVPTIFTFQNFAVRTITDANNEPWFVVRDVCDYLGLEDIHKAVLRVPEHHLTGIRFRSGGQVREMKIVDEPGLYRIVLRSDKPQAEPFMEWVTAEVLPAIRKTGSYSGSQANAPSTVSMDEHLALLKEYNELLRQMMSSLRVQANRRKNFTPDEDAQVLHLYRLGHTPGQIGTVIGRKTDSIRSCLSRLRRNGILEENGPGAQLQLFPAGALGGGEV